MKMKAVVVAMVMLVIAADTPNDESASKEIEKLQGKWKSESAVIDGKKPDNTTEWTVLVLAENRISWERSVLMGNMGRTGVVKYTYKIDPDKKPKEIDLTWAEFANKGKVQLGVYRLEDNTLEICVSPIDKERPKSLESKEASGHTFLILKRATP